MSDARPAPGTEMIMQWRKWDGSPHWRHECVYLGADEWGDWLGQAIGFRSARPGAAFDTHSPNATLIPADGDHAVTVFQDHPHDMRVYIDLAWDVRWNPAEPFVTGIDMDLDVVRIEGERGTWVDDRDEWAEHSMRYAYPRDVMTHLEALALDLETRVRALVAPFDRATGGLWLDRLAAMGLDR